jgi:hypothetical protein
MSRLFTKSQSSVDVHVYTRSNHHDVKWSYLDCFQARPRSRERGSRLPFSVDTSDLFLRAKRCPEKILNPNRPFLVCHDNSNFEHLFTYSIHLLFCLVPRLRRPRVWVRDYNHECFPPFWKHYLDKKNQRIQK